MHLMSWDFILQKGTNCIRSSSSNSGRSILHHFPFLPLLCYLPMFLEKKSIHISQVLLSSKYLFIIVPFLVSIFIMLKHGCLKKWFKALFVEKIKLQAIFSCIILGSIGLCFSTIYCLFVGEKDEKDLLTLIHISEPTRQY